MLNTVLSILGVLLLLFSVYALVMCVWVAGQATKAEKAFWEIYESDIKAHNERVKAQQQTRKETEDARTSAGETSRV